MKESVVVGLKKLGLTEYEAKAYAALVGLGEATAREIHQASKVPRTRIYDILRDLAEKGFVEFVQGSPTYYRVVEPEKILEQLRGDLLETIDQSERDLKSLNLEAQGSSPLWCVRSEWAINNRIRDFLGTVDVDLIIFCQSPEFLRKYKQEIKKQKPKMILVDEAGKFQGIGLDVKALKPEVNRVFYGQDCGAANYTPDCIMVKEGKESLVIGRMGQERMAIILKIPLLTTLQKRLLESLM